MTARGLRLSPTFVHALLAPAGGPRHGYRGRYHHLTRAGRERLEREAAVLADIVVHAREQGLLG